MTHRPGIRIAGTLFALLLAGCDNDRAPFVPITVLEVTPLYRGILEGSTVQLNATWDGQPAQVTWESENENIITVSPTGLVTAIAPGVAAATATMTGNPERIRSATITVLAVPTLVSGTAVTGLSASTNNERFFQIRVPAGATQLQVAISGGTGDADLYVRRGAIPTQSAYDCAPFAGGNNEVCTFSNPAAGVWYIMIHAWAAYANMQIVATVN